MPKRKRVSTYKRNVRAFRRVANKSITRRKVVAQVRKNTALLRKTIEAKQIYIAGSAVLSQGDFYKVTVIDGLAQGVADTGTGSTVSTGARIGNSINVKHMSGRIVLDGTNYVANPTNPNAKSGGTYRVIIYNSPCGADLTEADILRESGSTTAAMRSHYNVDVAQGKMYQIWFDKTYSISDAKPMALINFSKKWSDGKQVIYDNGATQPSNFRPRMLIVCDNVPSTFASINHSFKTRYEDL